MNYYLFQVKFKGYPESWKIMVQKGAAAQNYPAGDVYWRVNRAELDKLKAKDVIVAAVQDYRFVGYGVLRSGLQPVVAGPNDPIYGIAGGFLQRFDCAWTAIPFENDPVDCHDLKEQFDIRLRHLYCLKLIDENTFGVLKARLDAAGARKVPHQ
jgi:hypothetical protein